jgi:hypothetical protein
MKVATSSFDRNIVLTDPKEIEIIERILAEKKDSFKDAKPRTAEDFKKQEDVTQWFMQSAK